MSNPYSSFCDDFYVNMRLGSQLALPSARDTVLHFFERLQRAYPTLARFRKGENADFSLEEERLNNCYRWINLETNRLSAGHVNPPDIETAIKLHNLLLETVPYELGVSTLEIDYLDILFGFDLEFNGNHDEIVAESLYEHSPLSCLLEIEGAKPVDFQPTTMIALTPDCRLQARLDVITRTTTPQIRTGVFSDDVISVYLIVRRFWDDLPRQPMPEILKTLAVHAEQLATSHVLPRVVKPISTAIASRS